MPPTTTSIALKGIGTYKVTVADGLVGTTDLKTLLGLTTIPGAGPDSASRPRHADFDFTAGTVYVNVDGTAADANDRPRTSVSWEVRECEALLWDQLRFFVAAGGGGATIIVTLYD
jgi:hypothetical protein